MMTRFFMISGAVLGANPIRLLVYIWIVAAVVSLSVVSIVAAFPETVIGITADAFEETILKHGTLEEVEMLRELRQGSR